MMIWDESSDSDDYWEKPHRRSSTCTNPEEQQDEVNTQPTDQKKITDCMLNFVGSHYRLDMIASFSFRNFANVLNAEYEMPTKKEVKKIIIPNKYEECLAKMKPIVSRAKKVCLTMETWTVKSEKMESYITVTAHFFDDDFKFNTVMLQCLEMYVKNEEPEEIKYVARKLMTVTEEWGISDKVNFAVGDKANLYNMYKINGWENYTCMALALQKIVTAALKLIAPMTKKIADIASDIKNDSTAVEQLNEYQLNEQNLEEPLRVKTDIDGSWYFSMVMLVRFSKLEEAIRAIMPSLDLEAPEMVEEEWIVLKQICPILEKIVAVAQKMSAEDYLPASMALVLISTLTSSCTQLEKESDNDLAKSFITSIKSGVDTHFKNIEMEKNLAICSFLDPRFKEYAFSECGGVNVKPVMNLLEEKIKGLIELENARTDEVDEEDEEVPTVKRNEELLFGSLRANKRAKYECPAIVSARREIETYIGVPALEENQCPLEWWRAHNKSFPHLSQLFLENCHRVLTSKSCQSIFTKNGKYIMGNRNAMSSKVTPKLVFLNVNRKMYES